MKKEYLYQVDIRKWIENGIDDGIMIRVSGNKVDEKYDVYLQSYLLPIDAVEASMKNENIDLHPHEMIPGIMQENGKNVYHRWGNGDGIEPITIKRNFSDVAPCSIEVAEEFRLLFNLYFNSQKNEYIDVSHGKEMTVVKMNDDGYTTVHKTYLKRYLAVKEKALIIHIDSRFIVSDASEKVEKDEVEYRKNSIFYKLNVANWERVKSRLYSKNVIYGCSLRDSNIWPYEQKEKYVDFIIGIDKNGQEICHTCDPDCLNNNVGANPTAPHYLTPVYFDRAVLQKYYSKPEVYTVESGYIRCGSQWGLDIDNENSDYVSAYLGDLGSSLSEAEQYYWKGFNKPIGGKLSPVKFQRDYMCAFSSSQSPDFVFKETYERVNQAYNQKFGWPLFLPLTDQDKYNFKTLRVPVSNSVKEFDALVLSLVKVLIDSLNKEKITAQLTDNNKDGIREISALEAWLREQGVENYGKHIKFLRNLQDLRSSGSAHRKGKGYQKATEELDVKNENYTESFSDLLKGATGFLEFMENNIERMA